MSSDVLTLFNPASGTRESDSGPAQDNMGATVASSRYVRLYKDTGLAIEASWAGSPTGTLAVEVSVTSGSWVSLVGASASIATSPSAAVFNLSDLQVPYVRVKYTRTGGDGQLTVKAKTK